VTSWPKVGEVTAVSGSFWTFAFK